MKRILLSLAAALAVALGGLAALYFTLGPMRLVGLILHPDRDFTLADAGPAPDYGDPGYWAAWPGKDSLALSRPQGVAAIEGPHPVDVFFIHPTGYMSARHWNSPLDPRSRTEENTQWMLVNQASAFNQCCDIYAPRYREATIFRYLGASHDNVEKSMDLAYSDVERAFQYYIDHQNMGRPFIIASHSQGSAHAFRLIRDHVDGGPLAQKLVAAYVIGVMWDPDRTVSNSAAEVLKSLSICDRADAFRCIVHWTTFGDGGRPDDFGGDRVCVNPLSWRRDGALAPASLHKGAVPTSGAFSTKLWGDDSARDVGFGTLGTPVPALTWAKCENGFLIVADLSNAQLGRLGAGGREKNYHGFDYPLFYMDIAANAQTRIDAYLAAPVAERP